MVDVGGLWGDFGLGTGVHGCKTIIYEPQPIRARDIARSILLNKLEGTTTVHNAAVTVLDSVTLSRPPAPGSVDISGSNAGAGAAAVDVVPGERIDVVLAKQPILFLKVDVEGFEDGVIAASIGKVGTAAFKAASFVLTSTHAHGTHHSCVIRFQWVPFCVFKALAHAYIYNIVPVSAAYTWTPSGSFQDGLIQHAVFEYTPKQFEHKGTNYKDFLPRLFRDLGAKRWVDL